jgi:hypothetical protein
MDKSTIHSVLTFFCVVSAFPFFKALARLPLALPRRLHQAGSLQRKFFACDFWTVESAIHSVLTFPVFSLHSPFLKGLTRLSSQWQFRLLHRPEHPSPVVLGQLRLLLLV